MSNLDYKGINMWRPTKLNWHEPVAYACTTVSVVLGVYLAFTCEAAWLGRAGSVIIVIGVLLGSSRKIDVLHQKVLDFIADHRADHRKANTDEVRQALTKIKGIAPTKTEVEIVEQAIFESIQSDIEPLIGERRRVFKRLELILIVAGTLINGFGEWLIKLIQQYAT